MNLSPRNAGATQFLCYLAGEPCLLEAVDETALTEHGDGALMEHRIMDEVHGCLGCGQPARVALIAHTNAGRRWLDLCPACRQWVDDALITTY